MPSAACSKARVSGSRLPVSFTMDQLSPTWTGPPTSPSSSSSKAAATSAASTGGSASLAFGGRPVWVK